jgi:hypothetical protein
MKCDFIFCRLIATGTLAGWALSAFAAENPVPAPLQKPAWLTDCSLGVKESYDNNVFLSGVDSKYLPASYSVPAGSVAALKDEWSWITTVSPKIGVNFAPLLGDQKIFQTLSLAYAPDFAIYHDQDSESYNAHRFLTAIKGQAEPVSFSADNNFLFVDGSDLGPVYPGSLYSAFASTAARERREQIQDRANIAVQFDREQWFVRPVASLLFYDLMTEQIDPAKYPGYQNYADRYDINGGVDAGYKIAAHTALTLGYRYGHQYQQTFAFSPYNSSSDYQRVLVGIEGKPWNWLEVKFQGGPDFREYGAAAPVNDGGHADLPVQAMAMGRRHRQSAVLRKPLRLELPPQADQQTRPGPGRTAGGMGLLQW